MKRTFLVLCAAFAVGSVGLVGAQYGGGQSTSSKSSSHPEKSRDVTLTGCLEQGSSPDTFVLRNASEGSGSSSMSNSGGSSSGMSGSSSTSGGSSQGTSGSGQSTTGSEQTGTSGQSGTSMSQSTQSGMDYQLVGKSKDLKRYVGQRVEIKGKVEPMREGEGASSSYGGSATGSTSGSTSGTEGTTGSTSGSTGGETQSTTGSTGGSTSGQATSAGAVTHRVKVSSVKQLGSSCQ